MHGFFSISKEIDTFLNEDAISLFDNGIIALSDGAGGGGLFADLWAKYLVANIPIKPISNWDELDYWLSNIWEDFFNACEIKAKKLGGLALEKFYNEGSCATLASIWVNRNISTCKWIAYGDSVVFHYRKSTKVLEYSIKNLEAFNISPYLINCKLPPTKEGLKTGSFKLFSDSIVFVSSDTLSHYLLLIYYLDNIKQFEKIIRLCIDRKTKNSFFVKTVMSSPKTSFEKALFKLISCCKNKANMRRHITSLVNKNLIGIDDYSFGYIQL